MSKKFYIISTLSTLVLAAIIVSLFVYYKSKTQVVNVAPVPQNTSGNNYLTLPIEELAQKPNLEIETANGAVGISNIYKDPIEIFSNNGVSFEDNSNFLEAYYPQDNGFLITLNNPDLEKARKEAETAFLKKLGISQKQACELKVSITVPLSVNKKYGGGVYGFSFCPGAVTFK